jgi:Acetyltransferase (GNAT) family
MATVDAEEFDPPAGTFVVLIDGGEVLAGGGLRRVADDTCEVKRMWTAAGHRRKGYASQVLTGLEDAARAAGYSTLLLETGPLQPEAIALYTGRGYPASPTTAVTSTPWPSGSTCTPRRRLGQHPKRALRDPEHSKRRPRTQRARGSGLPLSKLSDFWPACVENGGPAPTLG